jgi:hypothetical protein
VVEGVGRGVPLVERAAQVCVDERGVRPDAEFVQHRRQQQRLVLAVAEAPPEDLRGLGRRMRVSPQFDAEVSHLVLHEAAGGQHALLRAREFPPLVYLRPERGRKLAGQVERRGPARHVRPGLELAELHVGRRVVPGGRRILVLDAGRDATLPKVLGLVRPLRDRGLEVGRLRAHEEPARGGPQQAHAQK